MTKIVAVISTSTPNPKRVHYMVEGWCRSLCSVLSDKRSKVVSLSGLPTCWACAQLKSEAERNCQMCNCDPASGYKCYAHREANHEGSLFKPQPVMQVDPELERLLAEEEEIKRRTQAMSQTRTVKPLVLNELEFLRLIADARSADTKRKLGDFYNDNRDHLICGSVVIRVD